MSAREPFGHSILTSVLLFNFAMAAFAQESVPVRPIFIMEARANSDNTLTIIGQNFGTGSPIVNLDDSVLSVLSNSDTQIVARLTVPLSRGIHMLAVSAGPESTEFDVFNLWIGPVETDTPQKMPGLEELRTAGLKEYSLGYFVEARRLIDHALALAEQGSDTYRLDDPRRSLEA